MSKAAATRVVSRRASDPLQTAAAPSYFNDASRCTQRRRPLVCQCHRHDAFQCNKKRSGPQASRKWFDRQMQSSQVGVRRGCSTPPCLFCRSVPASVAFENIFTQFRFRLVIFTGSVVHSGTGARAACFMRAPPMACTLSKLKLSPHQFTSSNHARGKAILPYRSAARRGAVTCDCLRLKPRAMAICSSDT